MNYEDFAKANDISIHKLRIYKPVFDYLEEHNWPDVTEALTKKWKIAHIFGYERLDNPGRSDGKWHVVNGRQRVCLYSKIGSNPTPEAVEAHLKYISNRAYTNIKKAPKPIKEKIFKCDRLNEAGWPKLADSTLFYSSAKTAEHFGYEPVAQTFVRMKDRNVAMNQTASGKNITLYKRKGDTVTDEELSAYLLSK